jgi:pimeloyl-ACP methyl ester carboxylesterase
METSRLSWVTDTEVIMKIQMNGWSVSYDTAGEGIPLLFIHGYPLSRKLWEPQFSALAAYGRVILPDLRGHGDSDATPGPYSMDMLAEDCANLIDNLGVTQPLVVCGLSMGGYVALAFYKKYVERMAGLILTATRAGVDSLEGKANRDKAIVLAQSSGAGAIADSMLPKMFAPDTYHSQPRLVEHVREMMASTSVEGVVGTLQAMKDRPDSTPILPTITKPVLIIHGSDDQIIPASEARTMQEAIPGGELVIIEGAGHLLNMEQPTVFNQAVHQFLKRC